VDSAYVIDGAGPRQASGILALVMAASLSGPAW
jgi:hypothetical protein